MAKKSIISITGKNGSGKSTTGKRLAAMLGYAHKSSGDFAREIGLRHNMTIAEAMKYAETHPEIDQEIDHMVKECGKEENLVIDSRLAFFWIPDSFKVYLDLDFTIAAGRVIESAKHDPSRAQSEDKADTEEQVAENLKTRFESDVMRYQTTYGVNTSDMNHFDLVINTGDSANTLDVVVQTVFDAYQAWKSKE